MLEPERSGHRRVIQILKMLSPDFLESTECFFGGGTRIVLELGEYRESVDVDFLCASQDGYKRLRNEITNQSLGSMFTHAPDLARDVRADMYGIRSYLRVDDQPVKFEIVREGRISLSGVRVTGLPVACLDYVSCIAEKLLANADRGEDRSVRSRDLIDLAYMAASWSADDLNQGLRIAEAAYGATVRSGLKSALMVFENKPYRRQSLADLNVSDTKKLTSGLRKLRKLAK